MLLDDVLSAVDAHVGAHIFEKCVLGFLAGRTRLLVSHAVALTIARADQVVVMRSGRVVAAGPPTSELPDIAALAQMSPDTSRHTSRNASAIDLAAVGASPAAATTATAAAAAAAAAVAAAAPTDAAVPTVAAAPTVADAFKLNATKSASTAGGGAAGGGAAAGGAGGGAAAGGAAAGGGLVQSEERARGAAKLRTYAAYLRAAGGLSVAVLYLLLLGLWSSLNPLQSVMLKQWMQAMEDGAPGYG